MLVCCFHCHFDDLKKKTGILKENAWGLYRLSEKMAISPFENGMALHWTLDDDYCILNCTLGLVYFFCCVMGLYKGEKIVT